MRTNTISRVSSISVVLPVVAGLMTLVLVAVFALYAMQARQRREEVRRVPFLVDVSYDLFAAIQDLRLERGTVNRALAAHAGGASELKNEIASERAQSRKALELGLAKVGGLTGFEAAIKQINANRAAFEKLRLEVDDTLRKSNAAAEISALPQRWLDGNAQLVRSIDVLAAELESELSRGDPFVAEMIRVKQLVWPVRSDSGDDRLIVREALMDGNPIDAATRHKLDILAGHIESLWKLVQAEGRLAETPRPLKDAIEKADKVYFTDFRRLRNGVVDELSAGRPASVTMDKWLDASAAGRSSLYAVAKTAFDLATQHAVEQFAQADQAFFTAIFLMALFLGLGTAAVWYVIRGVVKPITHLADTMSQVADGGIAISIPYEGRSDEIGTLSRALRIFRDNAIEKHQLHLAKVEAETANRTKSQFLANMSHELRTPLNAIIGFSEIIKIGMFGSINQRYRSYGADIFNSGNHLLKLINEILDLSKLEAGQLELRDEDVNLPELIRGCRRLIESQAERSKIRLIERIEDDLPLVRVDDRRFRQILINLFSNAVKFTPEGGSVQISVYRSVAGISVAISDTGIGMTEDEIPRALQPFGQIDSKISRKYEGTGLGLPLSKHLIELHGGTLTIQSEVNVGSIITIALPRERIVQNAQRPSFVTA